MRDLKLYDSAIQGDCKFTLQVETLALYREMLCAELARILPVEELPAAVRAIQMTTLPRYATPTRGNDAGH